MIDRFDSAVCIMEGNNFQYCNVSDKIIVGSNPLSIVTADFNNDDTLDLAVNNWGENSVIPLFGNGNGEFIKTSAIQTNAWPTTLAYADFNEDGYLDLAVTNELDNSVSILLYDPNALLRTLANVTLSITVPSLITSFYDIQHFSLNIFSEVGTSIGVVNASHPFGTDLRYRLVDDHADSSNPSNYFKLDTLSGEIQLKSMVDFVENEYFNITVDVSEAPIQSSRIFDDGNIIEVGDQPVSLAIADFNNDCTLDLAVVERAIGELRVLLGDGVGGFIQFAVFSIGNSPRLITKGDFDNDMNVDLGITNYGSNTVSILLGDGLGNFQVTTTQTGSSPYGITSADYDGDGNIDLAVTYAFNPTVQIFSGDGTGAFSLLWTIDVGGRALDIKTKDFNNDGMLDLAVPNESDSKISILYGNGSSNFTTINHINTANNVYQITCADFNSDGFTDIVLLYRSGDSVSYLISVDSDTFVTGPTLINTWDEPKGILNGDFNLDGAEDIIVSSYNEDLIAILMGNNHDEFLLLDTIDVPDRPWGISSGDLNGDGYLDFAVANDGNDTVSVFLNNPVALLHTHLKIIVHLLDERAVKNETMPSTSTSTTSTPPILTMTADTTNTLLPTSTTSTTERKTDTPTTTLSTTVARSTTTLSTTLSAVSTMIGTTGGTIESTTSGLTAGTSGGQNGEPNVVKITADETDTLSDTLMPAIISAVASGMIGFSFFIAQKIIEKKLQSKLIDMLGIEGNSEAIEFQKIVLAPIVQKLSNKVKLNGCMQTTSANRLNEYIEAVHILVAEFYKQGFTIKASRLTIMQRNLLTSIVAQQIKEVLLPKIACSSCQHATRFFKPVVTPDAIIESASEIATAVVQNIPEEVKQAALIDEKLTIETEPGCEEVCRRLNDSDRTDIKWRVETPTKDHPIFSVRSTVMKAEYDQIKELVKEGLIRVKAKKQADQTEIIISKINPDTFRQLYAQSAVMGTFATLDFGLDEASTGWKNNPLDMGGQSISGAGVGFTNDMIIAVPALASDASSDIEDSRNSDYGSVDPDAAFDTAVTFNI